MGRGYCIALSSGEAALTSGVFSRGERIEPRKKHKSVGGVFGFE